MADATVSVRSELNQLGRALSQVAAATDMVGNEVRQVASKQEVLGDDLRGLRAILDEFIRDDRLAKSLQFAQTQLIEVRQEMTARFGHHAEIRRTATGVLQAVDSGLVAQDNIRNVTEQQMITVTGYWLAPALVSIAAWIRDDKTLADKAVAEALRRSHEKAALFYTLVLRRFGRVSAVAQWLEQYLMRQDPAQLGREFIVVIDATAGGAFGSASKLAVSEITGRWLDEFGENDENKMKLRTRWARSFEGMVALVGTTEFPALYQVAKEAPGLRQNLQKTGVHDVVTTWLDSVFAGEVNLSQHIQVQVDAILTGLVTNHDAEELPLRRRELRYQAVVDARGDEAVAEQQVAANQDALDTTKDFPTLLADAALTPDLAGGTKASQRMAIALSKSYLTDGYNSVVMEYRAAQIQGLTFAIEGWTSPVPYAFDEASLVRSVTDYTDAETAAAVEAVKMSPAAIVAGVVAAVTVVLAFLSLPGSLLWLLVGAGLGVWCYVDHSNLEKRRDAARTLGEQNKGRRVNTLRTALAELVDYRRAWAVADHRETAAQEQIAHINPHDYSMTRADERGVLR